jgi:hypothetical protein
LLHVGSADELGSEVEVLAGGLLQIQDEGVVGDLQVALVRVKHDRLLLKSDRFRLIWVDYFRLMGWTISGTFGNI